MRIEVKYRDGHHNKLVSAHVVHERVTELQRRHGGVIEPKRLVDDARPARSPLHPAFTWDDREAAEAHRENQARQLIRSIVVIEYNEDDVETARVNPAFISVAEPFQESAGYRESRDAMSDPVVRASVVATQRAMLEGWVKRNANIQELADLAARVERDLAETARVNAAKRKRGKAVAGARA